MEQAELEKLFSKTLKLDRLDKNALYHSILTEIRGAQPQVAASTIVNIIDILFQDKLDTLMSSVDETIPQEKSPIFRRVT